jgi:4-hydroxythreonine-4-phosphate dehydrogenase
MQMIQHPLLVNLAVCTGEPAGIGPEVSVSAALIFLAENTQVKLTLIGDPSLLTIPKGQAEEILCRLKIEPISLVEPVSIGKLNVANAPYVLNILDCAIQGCLDRQFDAMVTAPIQKSIINQAGISFTGHTEYLAEQCQVKHVVMMLCALIPSGVLNLGHSQALRVALVTTHLPLKDVSAAISKQVILETIQIVDQDLRKNFGIKNPVLRIAGLNPHAGESGYLGREEIEIIIPAIESAKELGIHISGPYPGDTMFDVGSLDKTDAFIAMYHDQGLAPFKFVTFGGGVNTTLGLPIIRTSVDHGTALDLAGKGLADSSSMLEALRLAYQMAITPESARA